MQNGRAAGRRALQRLARIRNVRASDKHATRIRPNSGTRTAYRVHVPTRSSTYTWDVRKPRSAVPQRAYPLVEVGSRIGDREQLVPAGRAGTLVHVPRTCPSALSH